MELRNIVRPENARTLPGHHDKKASSYRMDILSSNLPLFNDEYAESIRQAAARAEAPEYRKPTEHIPAEHVEVPAKIVVANFKIPAALRSCIKCHDAPRTKHSHYCRTCLNAYHRSRYNYERERDKQLQANYGVSLDEYNALSHAQDDVCAICKQPEKNRGGKKRTENVTPMLHVDHDHVTGKIRGLLCSECNTAIGMLHEDPNRIKALLKYLGK